IDFSASSDFRYLIIDNPNQRNRGLVSSVNLGISYSPISALGIDVVTNLLPNYVFLQGKVGHTIFSQLTARYRLKKVMLLLQAESPFNKKTINNRKFFAEPNYYSSGEAYYINRAISIGFAWNFGRTKGDRSKTKEIQNTDQKSDKNY
ncbi:MAG: hypothetical protein H3C64_07615, partial [Candidatus Kuenenia stuttgartiensis]|nr:hypothetical protein [Candidatus Kuenenia stuttgartiensis]